MTLNGETLMAEDTTTELVETANTGAVLQDGIAMDPATGQALTEEDLALPVDNSTDLANDSNSTEQLRSESIEDEDPNVAWARSKGVDPTDPTAIAKLAKIARDNQREFTKTRQAESSLSSSMSALDTLNAPAYQPQYNAPQYDQYGQPLEAPVYQQPYAPNVNENKMNLTMFAARHAQDIPAGSEIDQEIGKVIAEDPEFWTSSSVHLERALKLAKANIAESSFEDRIEEARREERDRLTRKSSLQTPSTQSSAQSSGDSITTIAQAEAFLAGRPTPAELAEKQDVLERILGIELGPKKRR